ncbi:DUF4124 domain-containing protein [Comamonas sp. 4034]|uniref:DUF4124 domain-containing protein n=1 Tax=Comamonas sp. 4034 TaxID=3156455 RepID=UPI003D1C36C0
MKSAHLLLVCMALVATNSYAQVYKCKDPSGQLLLSDKPCASGELLQQKRSAEENLQDDLRAQEANRQKQERRAKEAYREAQRYGRQAPAYAQGSQSNPQDSEDCRLAQRDLDFARSSIARNANEKRDQVNAAIAKSNAACGSNTGVIQPPARAPTITMASCSQMGCYDASGLFYTRGAENLLLAPNGGTCTGSGFVWTCVARR